MRATRATHGRARSQHMIMNPKILWIVLGCAATISAFSAEQTESSKALGQIKALIGNWSGAFQWTGGRNDSGSMNATYYVTGNGFRRGGKSDEREHAGDD